MFVCMLSVPFDNDAVAIFVCMLSVLFDNDVVEAKSKLMFACERE